MSKAGELYNAIDPLEILAQEECSSYEEFDILHVHYVKYFFDDGSNIVFGSNGYIAMVSVDGN